MKALVCKSYGPIDNLVVMDVPSPVPGPKQLLIKVKAAAVNFPDALMVQGLYQVKPPLPFTPGAEIAGIVEAVGAEVMHYKPGDRVIALAREFSHRHFMFLDACSRCGRCDDACPSARAGEPLSPRQFLQNARAYARLKYNLLARMPWLKDRLRQALARAEDVERASKRLVYEVVLSDAQGNFTFGKADLSDTMKASIDDLIGKLKEDPQGVYIEIEGHTDTTGPSTVNERLALERGATAREVIQIMGEFAEKYGYGDSGECLTVGDPKEVWQFEIFGAGAVEKGAVWAAKRDPHFVEVVRRHVRIPPYLGI